MINLGKPLKNLGTATLNIQWPKEISNGKWLLYLMKVESKGLEQIVCEPHSEINYLKLKVRRRVSCTRPLTSAPLSHPHLRVSGVDSTLLRKLHCGVLTFSVGVTVFSFITE